MSLQELKKDIKNNKFKRVYLFFGPEEYLKNYYTDKIINNLVDKNFEVFNKVYIEGKCSRSEIMDACETLPIMSNKKVVIVKYSNLFSSKSVKNDSAADNAFIEYLKKLPEYICMIFCEENIDKRKKLTSVVKKEGLLVEFEYQKPNELAKWIIGILKKHDKKISNNLALKIVEYSEYGMNTLANEIEKILMYLGDREEVFESDINELLSRTIKSKVFDLIDAVSEKNISRSIKLLEEMMYTGEPIIKVNVILAKQFVNMLKIKKMSKDGYKTDDIMSQLKLSPYFGAKLVRYSKNFDIEKLNDIVEKILYIDVGIKSGRVNGKILLETLVATGLI